MPWVYFNEFLKLHLIYYEIIILFLLHWFHFLGTISLLIDCSLSSLSHLVINDNEGHHIQMYSLNVYDPVFFHQHQWLINVSYTPLWSHIFNQEKSFCIHVLYSFLFIFFILHVSFFTVTKKKRNMFLLGKGSLPSPLRLEKLGRKKYKDPLRRTHLEFKARQKMTHYSAKLKPMMKIIHNEQESYTQQWIRPLLRITYNTTTR